MRFPSHVIGLVAAGSVVSCARSPSAPARAASTAPAAAPVAPCDAIGEAARTPDASVGALAPERRGPWQHEMAIQLTASCRETAWPQAIIDCTVASGPGPRSVPCLERLPEMTYGFLAVRTAPLVKELITAFDRAGVGLVDP